MKSNTKTTKSINCPSEALKLLGDFWVLAIIQILSSGEKRYCEIERELKDSNPTTLTNRLKTLEEHSIIERITEKENKISVSYSLSEKGKAILPIIRQINIFALKYI